jgi:hypothetical protein
MSLDRPQSFASEYLQLPLPRRETKLDTLMQKKWLVVQHQEFVQLGA